MTIKNITFVHGKFFNSWEAQGLGFIGAYIKKYLPDIKLSFFQGCFDDTEEILKTATQSDLVCFSCTAPAYKYCVDIAALVKQNSNAQTIFGGYYPSATASTIINNPYIDHVVVGEGEQATIDIIKGNTNPIIVAGRMTFQNIPWPDRTLIKNYRNIECAYKDTGKRITSFQSNRGCPFKCKFCADGNSTLYKKGVCCRDIDDLLDEIQFVANEYRLDLVKFCDATWNINKDYIRQFCIRKRQRSINVPFFANIHANVSDDQMFEEMKSASCHEVAVGIESGSPDVLKLIGKGTTVESIKKTVAGAKKQGIKVRGYFILGMPNEGTNDIKMTEQLADELELDEYGFSILCPYPGCRLYEEYKDVLQNIDWSVTDEYSNDFWKTNFLSNEDLKYWQKYLVNKYRKNITWHNQKTI